MGVKLYTRRDLTKLLSIGIAGTALDSQGAITRSALALRGAMMRGAKSVQPVMDGLVAVVEGITTAQGQTVVRTIEGVGECLDSGIFTSDIVASTSTPTTTAIAPFVRSTTLGTTSLIYQGFQSGNPYLLWGSYNPVVRANATFDNDTHAVAYTRSKSSVADCKLFIDGTSLAMTNRSTVSRTGHGDSVTFGFTNISTNIKSWRLYNRVLTDDEIAQNVLYYRSKGWI